MAQLFINIRLVVVSLFLLITTSMVQAQIPVHSWVDSIANYGYQAYMPAEKFKWGWNEAVMLRAVIRLYREAAPAERRPYMDYIKGCMDKTLERANGRSPNDVTPGAGLVFLYSQLGEQAYLDKAKLIWSQYLLIPRVRNYGVSHRATAIELWDDTVYMISGFLLEMYRLTGDDLYLDTLIEQYYAHKEHLQDQVTGLWVHGWVGERETRLDQCSQPGWADPITRRSAEIWGRGTAWVVMTLADILEVIPQEDVRWKQIAAELKSMTAKLPELQDTATGLWYQLPARIGDSDNFLESSCSAMFAYAITVGIKHKILDARTFRPVIEKAYTGLRRYAVESRPGAYLSPAKVCVGTCIGDKAYYLARQQTTDSDFAIGVYVFFGLEYEKMYGIR